MQVRLAANLELLGVCRRRQGHEQAKISNWALLCTGKAENYKEVSSSSAMIGIHLFLPSPLVVPLFINKDTNRKDLFPRPPRYK